MSKDRTRRSADDIATVMKEKVAVSAMYRRFCASPVLTRCTGRTQAGENDMSAVSLNVRDTRLTKSLVMGW